MSNNINYINGKQYPFGFKNYLRSIATLLCDKHGCFKNVPRHELWSKVDPESWYNYFENGISPQQAVLSDLKEN